MGGGISNEKFEIKQVKCQLIKLQFSDGRKGYLLRIDNLDKDFVDHFQQRYPNKNSLLKKNQDDNYRLELKIYTQTEINSDLTLLESDPFEAKSVTFTTFCHKYLFHQAKLVNVIVDIYT